jgi:hypothetical protein
MPLSGRDGARRSNASPLQRRVMPPIRGPHQVLPVTIGRQHPRNRQAWC